MFVGREKELRALEKMYAKDNFQMAIVYGRRRVGKTSLLNEFVRGKSTLYLAAEEINDSLNLKKFSSILGEKLGITGFPQVEDWESFFTIISEKFPREHLVIVIDEYPYAANANKSLSSTLQHIIDYKLKNTNIFLILCGSSISFMEAHVLGEKSPLFGRRTGQLKVNPLDYYDASKFYEQASPEDKIKYYATVGGTPYYLSLIDEKKTYEENISELYFEMNGYLLNEGVLLMKQEFREPANYNAVLRAIASGSVILNEIVGFTKLENTLVSKYLLTLQELDYIEKVLPFGANPLKAKKSHYRIKENFIAFWYRYIFPVRFEIERGEGEIYFSVAMASLNEFIGLIFEDVSIQYLRRQNSKKALPFLAKWYGHWWGKDKENKAQEIDVVVEALSEKALILGECKWQTDFSISKTLKTLDDRASIFSDYKIHKYLFTKEPTQISRKDIANISARDYFRV